MPNDRPQLPPPVVPGVVAVPRRRDLLMHGSAPNARAAAHDESVRATAAAIAAVPPEADPDDAMALREAKLMMEYMKRRIEAGIKAMTVIDGVFRGAAATAALFVKDDDHEAFLLAVFQCVESHLALGRHEKEQMRQATEAELMEQAHKAENAGEGAGLSGLPCQPPPQFKAPEAAAWTVGWERGNEARGEAPGA